MAVLDPHTLLQAPPVRADGLQIEERPNLQRVVWRIERISWIFFLLVLLLALSGLTGAGGHMSRQTVDIGDAEVDLPRIARWQAADTMTLTLGGARKRYVLRLGTSFVEHIAIEQILPEPRRSLMTDGGIELEFAAADAGSHLVTFGLRPTRPGIFAFEIAVDGIAARSVAILLP